jgi:hypothetical protein
MVNRIPNFKKSMIFVKIRGSSKKHDPPIGGFFFSGKRDNRDPRAFKAAEQRHLCRKSDQIKNKVFRTDI